MKADVPDIITEKPEDVVFFAPIEEIKLIESVLYKLETTRNELRKVADGMKPVVEWLKNIQHNQ